jgi:hypothetical protein
MQSDNNFLCPSPNFLYVEAVMFFLDFAASTALSGLCERSDMSSCGWRSEGLSSAAILVAGNAMQHCEAYFKFLIEIGRK